MSERRAAKRLGLLATTLTELLLMLFFVTLLLGLRVLSDERDAKARADEVADSERKETDKLRKELALVIQERDTLQSDLDAATADEDWPEDFTRLVRQSVTARAEQALVEGALTAEAEIATLRSDLAAREKKLLEQEQVSRQLREALGNGLDAPARARLEASVAREARVRTELEELRARHTAALAEQDRTTDELRNVRSQAERLRREVIGLGRGLVHPPCWFDASGRIQFLVRVEIGEDALRVTDRWPDERDEDARQLPGATALAASGPLKPAEFVRVAAPILQWAQRQNPECRHFALVADAAVSKTAFKSGLLAIESAFYKRLQP
ncbi:MAG: hypothetical protein NDJ94_24380 [Vicinamibacteria bacterium]|nr:hypothetical protein [Vicinamibacteria bacterium]